jgi:hypothetical protein
MHAFAIALCVRVSLRLRVTAQEMSASGVVPFVLVFASAKNPGGGMLALAHRAFIHTHVRAVVLTIR